MTVLASIFGVLSLLAVGTLAAAIVACSMHRWRVAIGLSRAAVVAGVAVVVLFVLFVSVPRWLTGAADPAQRAIMLASGVAEAANRGAPAVLAALVSAIPCLIARRQLRAAKRRRG
jgi:hypothetical protein